MNDAHDVTTAATRKTTARVISSAAATISVMSDVQYIERHGRIILRMGAVTLFAAGS
jgi:hypothetical protein